MYICTTGPKIGEEHLYMFSIRTSAQLYVNIRKRPEAVLLRCAGHVAHASGIRSPDPLQGVFTGEDGSGSLGQQLSRAYQEYILWCKERRIVPRGLGKCNMNFALVTLDSLIACGPHGEAIPAEIHSEDNSRK